MRYQRRVGDDDPHGSLAEEFPHDIAVAASAKQAHDRRQRCCKPQVRGLALLAQLVSSTCSSSSMSSNTTNESGARLRTGRATDSRQPRRFKSARVARAHSPQSPATTRRPNPPGSLQPWSSCSSWFKLVPRGLTAPPLSHPAAGHSKWTIRTEQCHGSKPRRTHSVPRRVAPRRVQQERHLVAHTQQLRRERAGFRLAYQRVRSRILETVSAVRLVGPTCTNGVALSGIAHRLGRAHWSFTVCHWWECSSTKWRCVSTRAGRLRAETRGLVCNGSDEPCTKSGVTRVSAR